VTIVEKNSSVGDVAEIVQAAPWPALALTCDGRILRWNAAASAALDPLAEGLEGLRLTFALDDQDLSGIADLRIPLAHDRANPDAAAEVVLLDLGSETRGASLGASLTGALGDAAAEVADMIAGRAGLSAATSLSRAVAAVLAAGAALPKDQPEPGCAISPTAAKLLEDWRPRFAARGRKLAVTIDCATPEDAATPETALSNCFSALFELISGDPAYGDVAVHIGPEADSESVRIDIAVKAGDGEISEPALGLVAALARLHLDPHGGDAALATPGREDAMLLRLFAPAASRPTQAAVKMRPDLPDLGHISILMAEDNLTNQLVAAEMLKSMNATLSIASDGAEALDMLANHQYDVLLVDIEMPRVSGLEVIRRVRDGGGPQASRPIIALTAYAMNEHRTRIMEAGADGLIPKPILSIGEFGRSILAYLDGAGGAAIAEVEPAPMPARTFASSSSPVVEMRIYDALTEAIGPEATEELLDKVRDDLNAVREEIATASAAGEMGGVRRATHILISIAGAVGAVGLQELAERINGLANSEETEVVRELSAEALTELARLLDFVSEKAGAFSE
jgi:CheY-like chemotaxis protein